MPSSANLDSIAVARTDRLGDMVLTLPLIGILKQAMPEARLSLIAHSYAEPLLYECPAVDQVVYADRLSGGFKEALSIVRPEAIFFPRPRFNEALAAVLQRIPIRVGSSYRWYSPFFTDKISEHRSDARYHEAEYNVRMALILFERFFPGKYAPDFFSPKLMRPAVKPEAIEAINALLLKNDISEDVSFIILHPGSGGSAQDWPDEKFSELASMLIAANKHVILTGIAKENDLCNSIAQKAPKAINLCGKLALSEMIALLDRARIVVANSTGTLHIAAALGTSVVGLYPNSPHIGARRWGPLSPNSIILSPADGSDLMEVIPAIAVMEAMQKLFIK